MGFTEVHFILRHLICKTIVMPKESLTVFTDYPSVTKDQALEETVLTLFDPVIHSCFQFVNLSVLLLRL